jgi:hypothetical protein
MKEKSGNKYKQASATAQQIFQQRREYRLCKKNRMPQHNHGNCHTAQVIKLSESLLPYCQRREAHEIAQALRGSGR